jgi:anaerobic selenocysteine-containing dehydrogenase
MNPQQKSRRKFLKNAAALSAAAAFPAIITRSFASAAGKTVSAGEKVNLACIGIGNQGGADVASFAKTGLANFVAFCDVDMGAPHTQKVLEQFPMCRGSRIFAPCSIKWGKRSKQFR